MNKQLILCGLALMLALPAVAQQPATTSTQPMASEQRDATATVTSSETRRTVSSGSQKIKGVIVRRDPDSFLMRDEAGADLTVALTGTTKVKERKSNPFRGGKNYGATQLLRGLSVEVKGRGDGSGNLVAEEIKFSDAELKVAQSIDSRVNPVEGRLSASEENARRLSGQIDELSSISNAARGGARAAQETADMAMAGVRGAEQRIGATNERISAVDDYESRRSVSINFKVGSANLTDESKAALDEIAQQAKAEKGFVIEVKGFASADGGVEYNRRLSWKRADAVVRHLAENHMIPLRRIVTPFGYGEAQPVADNTTREGRQQNRRVEVSILVSRGLTMPVSSSNESRPATSTNDTATPASRSSDQPGQPAQNDQPRP